MAEKQSVEPWEAGQGGEADKNLCEHPTLLNTLMDNTQMLMKRMTLSDNFWTFLQQHGVVSQKARSQIQAQDVAQMQALELIQHVGKGKVHQFHGYLRSLVNSGQHKIVKDMGFNIGDYIDMEHYMKHSSFSCPACYEVYSRAYILPGCGHYVCRPCIKGAQYLRKDERKENITCPVTDCGRVSEASPTADNLGLEEDEAFNQLCGLVGSVSPAVKVEKADQHQEKVQPDVNVLRDRLQERRKYMENYKKILDKHEVALKEYLNEQEMKVKEAMEAWVCENTEKYRQVQNEVGRYFHQSVHWEEALDDLSVLYPYLKTDALQIPNTQVSRAGEELVKKLQSGSPIDTLITPQPYVAAPEAPTQATEAVIHVPTAPKKAKLLAEWPVQDGTSPVVAWTNSGELMVATDNDVWRYVLREDSQQVDSKHLHRSRSQIQDLSVAPDGTWIICLFEGNLIEIHGACGQPVHRWKPDGVARPYRAAITNDSIYVLNPVHPSLTVRCYNRQLVLLLKCQLTNEQYSEMGYIHIADSESVLVTSPDEGKIYRIDRNTGSVTSFASLGPGERRGGQTSVCTTPSQNMLICGREKVGVFNQAGSFIHYLDVQCCGGRPYSASVLARPDKPPLMALSIIERRHRKVAIYSLT